MSIDFGGTVIVKAKKEPLQTLKTINEVIYIQDCWSDNKCGPSQGYFRKALVFETKDYTTCYIVDNSIFSGFVDSERILIIDKRTKEKLNYKLEKLSETVDTTLPNLINKSYQLTESDYEYIEDCSFDDFSDYSETVTNHIPRIHIVNDKENYIFVDATIYEHKNYIIFKFDQDKLVNVLHYNKDSLSIETMGVKEVNDDEYISALNHANDALLNYDSGVYKRSDFSFDKVVEFKLNTIELKPNDDNLNNEKYEELKSFCEKVILPYIPKLDIGEYKDNTLTMPKGCTFISNYYVKYILHSLGLTSDQDLNNYYYRDGRLDELNLKLVIPGTVKRIGESAFMNKHFDLIVIDEGVETIDSYALYNCQAHKIKLPSTIVSIFEKAFAENSIEEIDLPRTLSFICGDVFTSCNWFRKINIDEDNAYYKTNDLKNVLIQKGEERLIIALNNAVIPEGVKIIGAGCFSWLRDSRELIIPNGVETIENNAFSTCSFENIVFPETLLEIGDNAFWQCDNLSKIVFPKSLRKIGDCCFTYCRNLTEVYFNSSVDIGRYCFSESTKLFNKDGSPMN